MNREKRFNDKVQFRAIEPKDNEPAKIVGYAIVWDTLSHDLGGFREIVDRNAPVFNNNAKAFHNHQRNLILGRETNQTLKLESDDIGLKFELIPNLDTQIGRDAYAMAKRNDYDGVSFAFTTDTAKWEKEERDDGEAVIRLVSFKLDEISPVIDPAYPSTSLSARDLGFESDESDDELTNKLSAMFADTNEKDNSIANDIRNKYIDYLLNKNIRNADASKSE